MPEKLNDVDQFMKENYVAPAQPQQSVSLPTTFDNPDLKPTIADTPEKQLIEYKVRMAALKAGIDPHMAAAVANKESGFNPDAVSPTGVKGVMQVSHIAAQDLGMDPSTVRNDMDANIQAGVGYLAKHGLNKYPDPAVRNSYVRDVMKQAQTSHESAQADRLKAIEAEMSSTSQPTAPSTPDQESGMSLSDVITGKKPGLTETQVGAAPLLAGSKSFLDALGVGAVERGIGKIPGAQKLSEILNNTLTGQDKSFSERATENQAKIKEAQAEHPIASGAGTVTGIVGQGALLNPAFKALGLTAKAAQAGEALSKVDKVANAAKLLTQGAVQGGTYEGLSNPNSTVGSVGKAAAVGAATTAVMAPVLAGAAKVAKGFGNVLVNFATRAGKQDVAQYIADEIGPTLNKASMVTKNQKVLDSTENELQTLLSNKANADKVVDVGEKVIPQDIMKIAVRKSEAGLRDEADQMVELASKLESQQGKLSLPDANDLKRLLWKESKFKASGDPGVADAAQFAYKAGSDIMGKIEDSVGGKAVKLLNQKLSRGIELDRILDASSSPSKLRAYMELGTAISHPESIPAIAAERAITSIPGATSIQALTGKVPQAVNPVILKAAQTLVPQLTKEKK